MFNYQNWGWLSYMLQVVLQFLWLPFHLKGSCQGSFFIWSLFFLLIKRKKSFIKPFFKCRYGGGMSSAKAALESDTKVLAFEAGRRHQIRLNTISAGAAIIFHALHFQFYCSIYLLAILVFHVCVHQNICKKN